MAFEGFKPSGLKKTLAQKQMIWLICPMKKQLPQTGYSPQNTGEKEGNLFPGELEVLNICTVAMLVCGL